MHLAAKQLDDMPQEVFPPQRLVTGLQLGQILRSTRRGLKMSQASIGTRLNLSQNRVSYLELHPEDLSFDQLLTWCAVLGLELKLGARSTPSGTDGPEW